MMAESQRQVADGTVESRDERHLFPMLGATTIVLLIAACKLVVHLYAGHRYGYLGDELYFLACSRHLAWGYVDQPPLIAMIALAVRHTLGQSLLAIRFLPALAGAVEVVLTALIARELGGRRFAQVLAAITTFAAPRDPRGGQHLHDECVRATVLDDLRVSRDSHHQNRK